MHRCLMLDVDGVLVNGRPEDGKSWATDIERDLGISPDTLNEVFFAPYWPDIVIGKTSLVDALDTCIETLSEKVTRQDLIDYWLHKDSQISSHLLNDCDYIRKQGGTIYLATNQEHERANYLMTSLGLAEHVDGMIYSAVVGARKPDPLFFETAQRISGLAAEDIVLVDDTLANVEAARQAGWHALQWLPESRLIDLLEGRHS